MTPLAFPIIVALAAYFIVLGFVAWNAFVVRKASVLEPIGQYLFFLTIFVVPLPMRVCYTMEIEGDVSPFLDDFAGYLPISLILVAASIPVFSAGYFSSWAARLGNRLPRIGLEGRVPGGWIGVAFLIALSSFLIVKLTQEVGGVLPFLLLGYKSTETTFGKGYLAVGFPWLIVADVALLECYARSRRRIYILWFTALLLVNIVAHTLTGNRGLILYLAAVIITFIHFRIRRLSLRVMLPLAVSGFIALNILGTLRNSGYTDVQDFLDRTASSAEKQDSNHKGLFYTLTIGEFIVPFETMPQMVRTVGVTKMPWLGGSALRALAFLVPSFLYPDRPLPIAAWYMQEFYGGGSPVNEGRAFFYLSEGYLNFGPFGVLLFAGIWGIGWGALQRWMQSNRELFGVGLIYALMVGFMQRCIAGDLVTILVATTEQSLLGVFIILGVARVFDRRLSRMPGIGHPVP